MCERYVVPEQAVAEREFAPDTAWWKFSPHFNVSPQKYVPAIRMHEGCSEGVMLRWGFIPSWFEGDLPGALKTQVGCGRLATSKIYEPAWSQGRRCILPMSGFYVWQLTPEKYRQPFFVDLRSRSVFGVAAVWDRWVSEDDDVIESCSIVCVPPNGLMADLTSGQRDGDSTNRGMPAILRRKYYRDWLAGSAADALTTLHSYAADGMQARAVSPRINSSSADDPLLIRAVS